MKVSYIENEELSNQIYQACLSAGFDDCGIISIDDMEDYISDTEKRIKAVPSSLGLYQRAITSTREIRSRFPWAKSIVICVTWIGKYQYPEELQGLYAKGFFLSRDSDKHGPEYRQKMGLGKWFDEKQIQWTGTIKDNGFSIWGLRHAAEKAGIGIIRRNNFLYNENGSWVELDGFLISEKCRLHQEKKIKPCPENCNICQKSCPTGALCASYTLNPNHCISAINTFGNGIVPDELQEEQLGTWIIGCEACQDSCPFNRKHNWAVGKEYSGLNSMVESMNPENILQSNEEELKRICRLTSDHILEKDAHVLKANAERALRNRKKLI